MGERPLFGFLYAQVAGYSNSIFREMLSGAHVEIEDPHSAACEFLIKRPGAHQRVSSHQSDDPQYGLPEGRVVRTLLVGTLEGRTWFQIGGIALGSSAPDGRLRGPRARHTRIRAVCSTACLSVVFGLFFSGA